MTIHQVLYLASLALCLACSLLAFRNDRPLYVFPFLLGLSILTEVLVMVFYYRLKVNYNPVYHLYLPLEYCLLAYYFYYTIPVKAVRGYILLSIPFYVTCSLVLSVFVTSFRGHPGWNFNLEGALLITWCLVALFTVEPVHRIPLVRLPTFWICLGILVFHTGIFFFNGIYGYLQERDLPSAERLNQLVTKNLNYLLYICLTLGFICSIRMKKYSRPL